MSAPRATGRAPALAVTALTLVAAFVRFPTLARSLWLDEAWRANLVLAPSDTFWNQLLGAGGGGIGAPMPPLFALVLRAVGTAVGHSAAGMRALPVLASLAAVPLAYVVGRRAAGTAAGLATALCFAASPTALLHGQELKQYSTDVAVVLLLLAVASTIASAPGHWRPWIVLAATMTLAPGLAFSSALVLPGIALGALACCRTNADRGRWLAAHVASGLAALAWYALVIGPQRERPLVTAYWAGEFPPLEGIPSVGWVTDRFFDFVGYASVHPPTLAAAVVVTGMMFAARWLGIAAVVSLATLIAAAAWRVYPLSGGRTTIFLLPFVYLGLGAAIGGGVDAIRSGASRLAAGGRLGVAIIAALLMLSMVGRGLRAPAAGIVYEETAPLIATIATERQPTDRVYVYDGAVQAFRFHHPVADPALTLGGSHRKDPTAYATELRPLLVPGTRLWVLFAHVHVPANGRSERDVILGEVSLYGHRVDVRETTGAELYLFEITRAPGTVRHLKLTPEDLADPERMKELLGR